MFWFLPQAAAIDAWRESGPVDVLDMPAFGDCPARLLPPGQTYGTLYSVDATRPPGMIHWRPVRGSAWWCGYAQRPRPAQLDRGVPLIGYEVLLDDEQMWKVPIVRPCRLRDVARVAGLPGEPAIIAGQLRYAPLVRYEGLIAQAERIATRNAEGRMQNAEEAQRAADEVLRFAVACLGVGYRVSWHEVCGLGLLENFERVVAVTSAALDLPEANEAQRSVAENN